MPPLIAQKLQELRQAQGMSRSVLSRQTVRVGYPGVSEAAIKAIESEPGRVPKAEIIEEFARVFGVLAEDLAYHEYPIAVARREGKRLKSADDFSEAGEEAAQRRPARRARRDATG